jgi:Secretion system C-terminal sorting domain
MISFNSKAQTPMSYSQPTSVSVCKSNGSFSVNLIDPPAGGWPSTFTLSLEAFVFQANGQPLPPIYSISNPWQNFPDCYSNVSGNNPIRIQNNLVGDPNVFTINSANYNSVTKCYDFVISTTNTSFRIEGLSFDLFLDCSLLNGLNSTEILIQRWFYNGAPTFLNIPAPSPILLNTTLIQQVPAQQIIGISAPSNSGTQHWDFSYENTGNTDVTINITHFETTPCSGYVLDGLVPIRYEVSSASIPANPNNPVTPFTSILIPSGHFLHIRQFVKIIGCMTDCNGTSPATTPRVNFLWKCANQTPPLLPPLLCSGCQKEYSCQLQFADGISSYQISRVEPTDPVALHNVECQGETTIWKFDVTNTGTNDLPTVKVDFENLFPNTFSLVKISSISVDDFASCGGTCHTIDPPTQYPGFPLGTCGLPADFTDFTDDFSLAISNLPVGETSTITFHVKNYVSDHGATFFNAAKYYNQWRVQSECSTICNQVVNPNYSNAAVGLNNGISGYSTSNNAPANDVNLATTYSGSPLHTTVYPPSLPPPSTPYFPPSPIYYKMCFSNIFGNIDDQQAFGFSAGASSDISGFLKVEMELKQGLTIGNPKDISIAFSGSSPTQLFPIYGDGFQFPYQSYSTATTGTHSLNNGIIVEKFDAHNGDCNLRTYTLYFRLSDLDNILPQGMTRKDMFKQGCLILGFTPCCSSGPQPSDYTIKISALPNETCFTFSSNTFTAIGAAQLCWLPLYESTGHTFVHCPGCVAPGIIIDDYSISRTSLGYMDSNNDGLVDNNAATPIPYFSGLNAQDPLTNLYLPEYNYLQLEYSTYGDEMEDYLIAHFQDGDNTNGGYKYSDMLADQATLDVIQLYRTFQNSGQSQYDVQITGFDFYIDDPAWNGGTSISDINDFPASAQQYPSLLKLSVSTNDLLDYMIRGTGTDDDKMLFTFSEAELQNPPSGTVNFFNGASTANIDFKVNQQYRLRVRYKVCGNPAPANTVQADDGEVSDVMFLTGLAKTTIPLTLNKMPETAAEVCSNLGKCFTQVVTLCDPCSTQNKISQATLSDPFLFYCEGGGAKHHFISTLLKNTADYYLVNSGSDDQCRAAIDIKSTAYFAKNTNNNPNNFFRYEYKAPKLFQTDFMVNKPADWDWNTNPTNVEIQLNSYNCEGYTTSCGISSPAKVITGVPPSNTINFDLSSAAPFECLINNIPTGAFIADEVSAQRIQIKLKPEDCSFVTPAAAADLTDCKVTFANNGQTCSQSTNGCSFSVTLDENSGAPGKYRTIQPPNPNLTAHFSPPTFYAGSNTVTWDFWVWNYPSPSNQFITAAKNVYLALNPFPAFLDPNSFLVNYSLFEDPNTLVSGPFTTNLTNNHYLWLTPAGGGVVNQLEPLHYFQGQITADISICSGLPATFPYLYGWSCEQQTDPPTALNVCYYNDDESVSLVIEPGNLSANGFTFSPTGYTACSEDPIMATATFQNNSGSDLTLQSCSLNIPGGSIVQANLLGFDINCTGTFNPNMNALQSLLLIPGECLEIKVEIITNGCHVGLLEMPKVVVSVEDFCGIASDCINDLLYLPSSGQSECDNCYSITKTVSPSSAQPGDFITFTITINSNNSLSTVITLNETLPPFFNMLPPQTFPMMLNVPAIGTTIIPVSGIFIDEGECADLTNIASIDETNQSATACVDVACVFPNPAPRVIDVLDDKNISTYGNTISNPCSLYTFHVYDGKTLTIDQDWEFQNCIFIMGSGSRIVVQGQQTTLNLNTNTSLYSCPRMWQGIRVTSGANILMSSSALKDADKGIFLEDNSHFEIKNSFFYDCVVGVYSSPLGFMSGAWGSITGTSFGLDGFALKGAYPGQNPFGTVGRAGILLNDISLTIGDDTQPENTFFNINYGIEIHNSNVDVYNCKFRDIIFDQFYYPAKPYIAGAAIFAVATEPSYTLNVFPVVGATNQTVENAKIGVYTERYNAFVERLNMNQVYKGVWSEKSELCEVQVRNCNIHASSAGIYWFNNDRAIRMIAYENEIHSDGVCIYAAEFNDGNNAHYQITFNSELRSNSSLGGIYLSGVENAQVGFNTIYNDGNPASGSVGIGLNEGRLNSIMCNTVMSTLPHSNLNSFGMRVNISSDNTIACNNFNASTTGVFFGGLCPSTRFSGNAMQNNWEGLRLNNTAIIDDQVHQGNQWINYQSPFGAQNFSNPSNSEFEVHTFPGSNFNPAVNLSGWFGVSVGSPYNCANSQTCNASIVDPPGDVSATDRLVATDSIQAIVYSDETRSMARLLLFEKMQRDTVNTWSDSIFVAFYNETAMSPIGELNRVSTTLAHSLDFDLNEYALLSLADSLIKLKSDSIHLLDSLQLISPSPNYKIIRESIISHINNLRNAVRSILTSKALQQGILRDSARLINSAIQPTELPEQNQQIFNEIATLYQEYGDSVLVSNYNTLLSIAQQCPYAGGGVVYKARDFLARVNDSIVYHDDAICLQQGIFRELGNAVSIGEIKQIKLIPNPASNTVDIVIYPEVEEFCRITISNTMGEEVFSAVGDRNEKIKTVDVSKFSNGIYVLSVRCSSICKNAKLIITR